MPKGGLTKNTKLLIALGLLLVAGIVLFLQLRSGGNEGLPKGMKQLSEAERQAQQAEHERQLKAAEASQKGSPAAPPAQTGGAN